MRFLVTIALLLSSSARVLAKHQHSDVEANRFQRTPPLIPLQEHAGTADLFPMPDCAGFPLEEASIDDMRTAMEEGRVTAVRLTMCYMTRIFQTQPYINSVIQVNPDALAIAAAMDEERSCGKVRGPLHGIPFMVKDSFATLDNLETTAGSWALLGSRPPRDAHTVGKLRSAGGVLLGKTTLSEWADMRSSDYSEGYSARGGQCRSGYNLTANPGGSSSGSAVAVAANCVAFSLGTETDGSVISPAERNALCGIKPTVGLTSRAGVIPESEHQDSVGTFGRTVRDATYALDAIYGIDKNDNYTLAQRHKTPKGGFVQALTNKTALRGARFGLPWESFWVHAPEQQRTQLLALIDMIRAAGATIINGTEITKYKTIVSDTGWDWDWGSTRGFPNESEFTYIKVDFYNNIGKYLSELGNTNMKSIHDLIQYNFDNDGSEGGYPSPRGHPAFASGQDSFIASAKTKGVRDQDYWQALEFCQTSSRQGIDDALRSGNERLDGLLVPPEVGQTYQIAAQAGYPMVSIPAGINPTNNMPYGLAIMHTAFAEGIVIKWASAIEDLQLTSRTAYKRTRPTWEGYLERNLPLPF